MKVLSQTPWIWLIEKLDKLAQSGLLVRFEGRVAQTSNPEGNSSQRYPLNAKISLQMSTKHFAKKYWYETHLSLEF